MYGSLEWRLLGLADGRMSVPDKEALIAEWNAAIPCCLAPGFARQLKMLGCLLLGRVLWCGLAVPCAGG